MEPVDQLLFGYREGHGLIAGSMQLAPSELIDVLPHVDASVQDADEQQLVGIWVASLSRYLLARIWAAPESGRPGAVWAHALLLSPEQVDSGRVGELQALLRRPSEDAVAGYDARLEWPAGSRSPGAPPTLMRALARAARSREERECVVLWPHPAQAEGELLALLDAMAAGRRRELSFRILERVRAGSSPYRVQVGASFSGGDASVLVIDARPHPPADEWARS